MNRPLTTVFAFLEALLVVGIGIGIPLVPLTIMWGFQFDLLVDWVVFWRAAVDIWLLGHGVELTLALDAATAAAVGHPAAAEPFVMSLAPLGFGLLTVLLGHRAGRRIAETPHRTFGAAVTVTAFAVLAIVAALTAAHEAARPTLWQAALFPTLLFAAGGATGFVIAVRRLGRARTDRPAPAEGTAQRRTEDGAAARTRVSALATSLRRRTRNTTTAWGAQLRVRTARLWSAIPPRVRRAAAAALRGGLAAVAGVLAVSALLVAVLLATGYAQIIALYESAQGGVLGGVAITLAQLALLPNLVIWAACWLLGPGFAIGAGSAVSPLGTSLGPIPGIPVLGALPAGDLAWGFLGLLVPVIIGFAVGLVLHPKLAAAGLNRWPQLLAAGAATGLVAAISLLVLAWWSSGSAAPGRLLVVGANPLLVGAVALLEVGIAATVGMLAASARRREPAAEAAR